MTDEEWLACEDALEAVAHLHRKSSERKFLLLACEIFRHFHPTDADGRRACEVLEGYAEGTVPFEEVVRVKGEMSREGVADQLLFSQALGVTEGIWGQPFWRYHSCWQTVFEMVREVLRRKPGGQSRAAKQGHERARAFVFGALHDVYGPIPKRPVPVDPAWMVWNGGTVFTLANDIYDRRAFADMPILADALEEAGCADGDVLGHCRRGAGHVRGCWLLDTLLGKDEVWREELAGLPGQNRQ